MPFSELKVIKNFHLDWINSKEFETLVREISWKQYPFSKRPEHDPELLRFFIQKEIEAGNLSSTWACRVDGWTGLKGASKPSTQLILLTHNTDKTWWEPSGSWAVTGWLPLFQQDLLLEPEILSCMPHPYMAFFLNPFWDCKAEDIIVGTDSQEVACFKLPGKSFTSFEDYLFSLKSKHRKEAFRLLEKNQNVQVLQIERSEAVRLFDDIKDEWKKQWQHKHSIWSTEIFFQKDLGPTILYHKVIENNQLLGINVALTYQIADNKVLADHSFVRNFSTEVNSDSSRNIGSYVILRMIEFSFDHNFTHYDASHGCHYKSRFLNHTIYTPCVTTFTDPLQIQSQYVVPFIFQGTLLGSDKEVGTRCIECFTTVEAERDIKLETILQATPRPESEELLSSTYLQAKNNHRTTWCSKFDSIRYYCLLDPKRRNSTYLIYPGYDFEVEELRRYGICAYSIGKVSSVSPPSTCYRGLPTNLPDNCIDYLCLHEANLGELSSLLRLVREGIFLLKFCNGEESDIGAHHVLLDCGYFKHHRIPYLYLTKPPVENE